MPQNKVGLELRAQLTTLIVMVPVLYFLAQKSLELVACGLAFIYLVRWILLVSAILPSLNSGMADMIRLLKWLIFCALLSAQPTFLADQILHGISSFPRLITDIATASVTMIVLMQLFGKRILRGAHGDYLLANGRFPGICRMILGV